MTNEELITKGKQLETLIAGVELMRNYLDLLQSSHRDKVTNNDLQKLYISLFHDGTLSNFDNLLQQASDVLYEVSGDLITIDDQED
jgi:hypothetical protein